jgi:hypothetical protein
MTSCDILDIPCWFINEIIGSIVLASIFMVFIYFIIAAKLKFGFDTTIAIFIPVLLIIGLMFTGFSVLYAFATFFIALLIAFVFQKIIGNR